MRVAERAYTFSNENDVDIPVAGSSVWTIVRMVLVLALSAAAIYGIVFFLKKKTAKEAAVSDPFLKVLANSHLGNNRYAHIVAVGKKAWLLGSSDGGVNLIGEIDDKEIIDAMLLEDSERGAEVSSNKILDFSAMLRKLGVGNADNRNAGAEELRRRRERLRNL